MSHSEVSTAEVLLSLEYSRTLGLRYCHEPRDSHVERGSHIKATLRPGERK